MRLCCMVTTADGTVVSQTSITAEETATHAVAMAGHVIRMMRTGNVVPEYGQRLTVWIEDDPDGSSFIAYLRRDQLDGGEVGPVAGGITGEQPRPEHRRVRADEEVGQDRGAVTASLAIATVGACGEESGVPRNATPHETVLAECSIEGLDVDESA